MFLGNLSQKGQCDHVLPHNYRWQKQATFVSDGQMCIVAENQSEHRNESNQIYYLCIKPLYKRDYSFMCDAKKGLLPQQQQSNTNTNTNTNTNLAKRHQGCEREKASSSSAAAKEQMSQILCAAAAEDENNS